jgi:NADPH:quinone reductase-like Zn-dependent oxidoreductase
MYMSSDTGKAVMKAIVHDRYGPPSEVLELRDVDVPAVGDDDVLVRVHAAGIHAGIWHAVTPTPQVARVAFGLRKPKNPGVWADVAGRVEAVGRNVTRFQPGDEVFGVCSKGAIAEYAVARHDKFEHKPANVTFEQAAVVTISGVTALQALRDKGKVQPGQRVLVTGAGGGVGSFTVQIAKVLGAHVTGVCSTAKVDLVRSLGADRVIDYTREDFADGTRYDLIVDIAGNRKLSHLRKALTPEGTLVLIGGEDGGGVLAGLERNLQAALLSPFTGQSLGGMLGRERQEDLRRLRELMETGEVTPAVDRTYPLPDAAEAIRYVQERRSRGKVAVTI